MTGLLRRASCNAIRGLLQDGAVVPALRTLCAPFRASASLDLANLAAPVVFVANHASHLDAPAILAALPRSIRHRTAFAAAEDYFYRNRLLGFAVGLAIGAFPFPRHGSQGVERAAALLADGWNVVLFPEGTRSADGAQQLFRDGVGRLLLASHTAAVPLAIEGTRAVWPRSRRLPRFSPGHGSIAVRLGRPWRPWPDATPREISAELLAAGRRTVRRKPAPRQVRRWSVTAGARTRNGQRQENGKRPRARLYTASLGRSE